MSDTKTRARELDLRAARLIEGGLQAPDVAPTARERKSGCAPNSAPRVWVDVNGEASAEDSRRFRELMWSEVQTRLQKMAQRNDWLPDAEETVKIIAAVHEKSINEWERKREFDISPQVIAAEQRIFIDGVQTTVQSCLGRNGLRFHPEYETMDTEAKCRFFRRHDKFYAAWGLLIAALITKNANLSQYRVANSRQLYRTNLQVKNIETDFYIAMARFEAVVDDYMRVGGGEFPGAKDMQRDELLCDIRNTADPGTEAETPLTVTRALKRSSDVDTPAIFHRGPAARRTH